MVQLAAGLRHQGGEARGDVGKVWELKTASGSQHLGQPQNLELSHCFSAGHIGAPDHPRAVELQDLRVGKATRERRLHQRGSETIT